MTTIYVDLWSPELRPCPKPLQRLEDLGMRWERSEGQPMADQIKLEGCTNVPDPLPAYLRLGDS